MVFESIILFFGPSLLPDWAHLSHGPNSCKGEYIRMTSALSCRVTRLYIRSVAHMVLAFTKKPLFGGDASGPQPSVLPLPPYQTRSFTRCSMLWPWCALAYVGILQKCGRGAKSGSFSYCRKLLWIHYSAKSSVHVSKASEQNLSHIQRSCPVPTGP